jgi:signal transduction histidine kinase
MRLAPRLAITFGALAALSTAAVGFVVSYRLSQDETEQYQRDVARTCDRVVDEVERQGEADQRLIAGACAGGELVDRVVLALNGPEFDARRTSFSLIVPEEREAFDVDELFLGMQGGDIVGASPASLLALQPRDVDTLLAGPTKKFTIRTGASPAIVTRCTKPSASGRVVGLVAVRHLDPVLERLGKTLDLDIRPSWPKPAPHTSDEPPRPRPKRGAKASASAPPPPVVSASASPSASATPATDTARATCKLPVEGGQPLTFDILRSTRDLDTKLEHVNRAVGVSAAISAAVAFLVAIVLGLSLGRPLSVLAREAGKVAQGEARPMRVRGSGEVKELVSAFDRMIQDLAVTRRRLAAASRVAAWREVARRVAHEVKNPLAPIRAAVETLRRLRAREDPAFDEYFDEATRTVLDEVHRISNIVTEFTRFARLPQPRPQDVDPEELARHVIGVHKAAAETTSLRHVAQRRAPTLRADRDQVIQVLTNLVQNALDAVKGNENATVTLTTDTDGHYVSFSVVDDGPGIAPDFAARLFEPYATTKASGTGLGLAIAQRIALEHNGELSYLGTSANGRGAVFRLLLPIEGPPPLSETPPSSDG